MQKLAKLTILSFLLLLSSFPALARARVSGFCQQGGQTIMVLGYTSSAATPVQASYPRCTVRVTVTGGGLASIFSDNAGTVLANPFTLGVSPETSTNGYWFFYVDNGTYDIQFSGTGITSPFTLPAVPILDAAAAGTVTSFSGSGPSWLTWTVATPTTTPAVTLAAATGQTSHQVIGTCGTATSFTPCALVAGDLPSLSGTYCALAGCTMTGSLLFTDALFDIGASGLTRPRNIFLSGNITAGGTIAVIGHTTFEGVTSTGATGTGALVYSTSPALTTPALGTPSSGTLTNATGLPLTTGVTGVLPIANGGTNTAATLTGIVRGGAAYTAAELSGDATTSGSNVVTVSKLNGTSFAGANGDVVSFGAANTPADSGVVAANVVTATGAATVAKMTCVAGGATKTCTYIDMPAVMEYPSAECNNVTASPKWSIGAMGTASCNGGTNNKLGYIQITDTASSFAQFATQIPFDWDSTVNPYIRFQIESNDVTIGHTIIPQIQISCAKGDGTTSSDVTFNAAHSASTITTNAITGQFWSTSNIQMNNTDMTGCIAGSFMIVQVGRATDTATSAFFYGATVTFPRLLTVQAN